MDTPVEQRTKELEQGLNKLESIGQEELKRASDILEQRSTKIVEAPAATEQVIRVARTSPVLDKLVQAEPSWTSKPSAEGNFVSYLPPRPTFSAPKVTREIASSTESSEPVVKTTDSTSTSLNTTLTVIDASVTDEAGDVSNKVLITDGKIDGQFPSGMPSGDSYILDLADPADSLIYAGMTFNPTTLATTSRFIGVSGSGDYPESRVESNTEGFLYWLLGFTYFDGDGNFKVKCNRIGDVYNAFSYGANNGLPALLPIPSEPGWLDLTLL